MTESNGAPEVRCFVCDAVLNQDERSKEHFVPRWLPNLATEGVHLRLNNDSPIKAGQLHVPACHRCNKVLGAIEDRMSKAFRDGADAVRALDPTDLTAWAAKVLWGFAVLENRLAVDRRSQESAPIISDSDRDLLRPLQSIARAWVDGRPMTTGSVFVFNVQHAQGDDVDYFDDPPAGVVAVHVGGVGLVVCAADHGDLQRLGREAALALGYLPVFTDLTTVSLGPIQFREVAAWASAAQRSRPPFPQPGTPYVPCDPALLLERFSLALGVFGYKPTDLMVGGQPITFLFDEEAGTVVPRFVSLDQTRAWAAERAESVSSDSLDPSGGGPENDTAADRTHP